MGGTGTADPGIAIFSRFVGLEPVTVGQSRDKVHSYTVYHRGGTVGWTGCTNESKNEDFEAPRYQKGTSPITLELL